MVDRLLTSENETVPCEACNGSGRWETECCNGSGGCDCGGQVLDMGNCNVCGGSGMRKPDADVMANVNAIRGLCYIGAGPQEERPGMERGYLPFRRVGDE